MLIVTIHWMTFSRDIHQQPTTSLWRLGYSNVAVLFVSLAIILYRSLPAGSICHLCRCSGVFWSVLYSAATLWWMLCGLSTDFVGMGLKSIRQMSQWLCWSSMMTRHSGVAMGIGLTARLGVVSHKPIWQVSRKLWWGEQRLWRWRVAADWISVFDWRIPCGWRAWTQCCGNWLLVVLLTCWWINNLRCWLPDLMTMLAFRQLGQNLWTRVGCEWRGQVRWLLDGFSSVGAGFVLTVAFWRLFQWCFRSMLNVAGSGCGSCATDGCQLLATNGFCVCLWTSWLALQLLATSNWPRRGATARCGDSIYWTRGNGR